MTAERFASGLGLRVCAVEVVLADRGGERRMVLDVEDFRVEPGTHVAICGPSGSGKTTLLHVLAGIERPSRGTVHWGAVEVTALASHVADRWRRETLGFVFQQFHLFAGLSALQNVLLPLRFDRWQVPDTIRIRALRLLNELRVRPHADVSALSRGEAQRVTVARALIREPAIVLADEPTASLDAQAARTVADLLAGLCRDAGATLIVATHDPGLAARLDRTFDIVYGDVQPRGAFGAWPRLVGSK